MNGGGESQEVRTKQCIECGRGERIAASLVDHQTEDMVLGGEAKGLMIPPHIFTGVKDDHRTGRNLRPGRSHHTPRQYPF